MPKTKLAAALCSAALLAGCGSSSKAPAPPNSGGSTNASRTSQGALAHTGPVGTVPPASGRLNVRHPTVLTRIDARLVTYYTSKGFTGVTAICTPTNSSTASCRITGTDSSGEASSTVLTVAVDPSTGLLKVTRVTP